MLTEELKKYRAHIIAIQEIKWIGKGILQKKECDVYYSCHERKHVFGTGFVVDKKVKHIVLVFVPISERICCLRVKGRFFNMRIINVHAPTEDKEDSIKDEFYEVLEKIYDSRPKNDVKILIGGFNAQIGRELVYRECAGRHSLHEKTNVNGTRLANFAISRRMFIGSTKFEHKDTRLRGKDRTVVRGTRLITY